MICENLLKIYNTNIKQSIYNGEYSIRIDITGQHENENEILIC